MATEFCQRCKQSHPGRVCDYDEEGECAETVDAQDTRDEKSVFEKPPINSPRPNQKICSSS
jgi:hypothetical protein